MFVLAHPVGHVRASAVMNAHFESIGKNVAVSPLHVAPEDLGAVLGAIRKMRNVIGFGVTIPHKIEVIKHLDEVTATARDVGAANFVRREESGRLVGDNIDGAGFVAGLARNGVSPAGKSILQIGAGGAGRAVAFALAAAGARELHIANRDSAKAQALAEAVSKAHPGCTTVSGPFDVRRLDIIVNTTSVGMKETDPLPVEIDGIGPDTVVADVIMTPPVTPLIARAAAMGCKSIGGKIMLDEQMKLVEKFVLA
ncbi:shikimate dehydrogenase family protein [Mesorhizobium sp. ANAO-SY3R2]|uniref:shikimate dehydrogenase family protein n=1 Tax=Mesorhizobium sp. ANAO-SY3R2 TaxID=3166644 RepID=UPI00366D16C9